MKPQLQNRIKHRREGEGGGAHLLLELLPLQIHGWASSSSPCIETSSCVREAGKHISSQGTEGNGREEEEETRGEEKGADLDGVGAAFWSRSHAGDAEAETLAMGRAAGGR